LENWQTIGCGLYCFIFCCNFQMQEKIRYFGKLKLILLLKKLTKTMNGFLNVSFECRNVFHGMCARCTDKRLTSVRSQAGVNFINILHTPIAPIFLCQKKTKPNCNKRKALQNTFVQKVLCNMLMKLIPVVNFIIVLQAPFLYEFLFGSFSLVTFWLW